MGKLSGKVALVTGGSRGIGRAVALRLAAEGATVVVNYLKATEAADQVVTEIRQAGGQGMALQGDVSQYSEAQRVVKTVTETFGRMDILVNNAGTTRDNLLALMKEEDFDHVIRVDLKSVFNMSKAALRPMMRQKFGRIVNMTSIAGLVGNPGQTNYSAAKAGIIGFTKSMAKEYGAKNITVNAVAPGFVPTDLTSPLPQDIKDYMLKMTALGRAGSPEDMAGAVVFFVSDDASYVTGQVLAVDGGIT